MEQPVVLLVEDHQDTQEAYAEYLTWCGLRADTAGNGNDALRRLHEPPPVDAVVMDMGLPDLTGWEAVRLIRADPAIADVPVVAFSGYAARSDRLRAEHLGCDAFVAKPALPSELAAIVSRVLTRHWARLIRETSAARRRDRAVVLERTRALVAEIEKRQSDLTTHRQRLAEALAELRTIAAPVLAERRAAARPLVLIVEPEPAYAHLLDKLCRSRGYDVILARGAEEGLACLVERPPQVILMDTSVPGRNGCDALRQLKSDAHRIGVPVVLMTDGPVDEPADGAGAVADSVLRKPASPAVLVEALKQVIRKST